MCGIPAGMRYAIVIEHGPTSWGAHVPDLPGCAVVGRTEEEARTLIREAIGAHVEALQAAGPGVPEPSSTTPKIRTAAAPASPTTKYLTSTRGRSAQRRP